MIDKTLREKIHEANIELHRVEAKYYGIIHQEIFNNREQKRIVSTLNKVDELVDDNHKKALDVGAGTGNLTGKLLHMNYDVTAVDISKEMCEILKKKYKNFLKDKKLRIINSKVEDTNFNRDEFDLITCYSVLHHLPNYVNVIRKLSISLKKGGIMYLDHEPSPFWWNRSNKYAKIMKKIYLQSNWLLTRLMHEQAKIVDTFSVDYTVSDYWCTKTHHLKHNKVKKVFEEEKYEFFTQENYHLYRIKLFNVFFYIYKYTCEPDASLWIAKK